ncbi:MAG: hypothetical protein ACRC57_11685 [Sarcina sp.]
MHRVITDTNIINNFTNNSKSHLKKGYLLIKDNFFYFSVEPISENLLNFTESELKEFLKNTYNKSAVNFSLDNVSKTTKDSNGIEFNPYNISFGSKKLLIKHDITTKKEVSYKMLNPTEITPVLFNYNSLTMNLLLNFTYFFITIFWGVIVSFLLKKSFFLSFLCVVLWFISCYLSGHALINRINKNILKELKR